MRDIDVRESVWILLESLHAKDNNTFMLNELGILNGLSRIDIAVINGEIAGFELKSERDTLERLPNQRDLYNMVFDRVTLVVAENHRNAALEIIPNWWGVFIAHQLKGGCVEINQERESGFNEYLDPEALCAFLWRNEAIAILEKNGASRGVKSKSREIIYKRISAMLDLNVIRDEVRRALKIREGWRLDQRLQRCGG